MSDLSLEEYQRIKEKLENLQRKRNKAEGAREKLLEQLKEQFDLDSFIEAKEYQVELETKLEKKKNKFEILLTRFQEKWGDLWESEKD